MSLDEVSALPMNERFEPIHKFKETWLASLEDPEGFWGEQAKQLDWFKGWDIVLEWKDRHARWFKGGLLNASHNCLDRHIKSWKKNKVAYIWEGENGDRRVIT